MSAPAPDPWALLRGICEGNRRWLDGHGPAHPADADPTRVPSVAAVLCSDHHHPAEPMLGLHAGELLVAQAPGPFVGASVLSAIGFGVQLLGIRLVLVITHHDCPLLAPPATAVTRLPTTVVERTALSLRREAHAHGGDVAACCARRQAASIHGQLSLPRDTLIAPAVRRAGGRLQLL